jgi:hypothetical protein
VVWSRQLGAFFTPTQIATFSHSVSSTWWFDAGWLDAKAGDFVVLFRRPRAEDGVALDPSGRRTGTPRLLRVRLADGSRRFAEAADLTASIGSGDAKAQQAILDALVHAKPEGWRAALERATGDAGLPLVTRVAAGVHLLRAGDRRALDLVRRTAEAADDREARLLALSHLAEFLDLEALPALRTALSGSDRELMNAAWRGFARLEARALEALVAVLEDDAASLEGRALAAGLLARLGAAGAPALPALRAARDGGPADLAQHAKDAVQAIERAVSAPVR